MPRRLTVWAVCGAVVLTLAGARPSAVPSAGQAPTQTTIPDTDAQRIADLVTANHILFDQGVVDAYGHVSVRSVRDPSHYFLARAQAPALVTREDILEYDENGNALDQRGRAIVSERFIHGEILRARPDVQAVVHGHSPAVVPFSVSNVPLRPVMHMAGFLPATVPVFEIRTAAGPGNNMLVQNTPVGTALAKVLGDSSVVLMRGHGMAVVGPSVRHAVSRAIYTQLNAQVQLEALRLGSPVYMTAAEARGVNEVNEGTLLTSNARQWLLWEAQANARATSGR